MKKCYELAIAAGKKGYDSFGAILVSDGKILEEDVSVKLIGPVLEDEGMRTFEY